MRIVKIFTILVSGLMVCWIGLAEAVSMSTAFTYQGRLMDTNSPADDLYDFQFKLFNSPADGNQVGSTIDINNLDVIDGYFTVVLDFSSNVFDGNSVWLQIDVRPGDSNDPNAFIALSPRQELTPTPYALKTRGIFVDDRMNVGMGTTGPKGKLHVDGGKASDDTDASDITIKAQEGGDAVRGLRGRSGGDIILLPGEGGESPPLTPPGPSGKVGIGTTKPGYDLDVVGNINFTGNLYQDGSLFSGGGPVWTVNGSDIYFNAGNVGIGTAGPSSRLNVAQDSSAWDEGIRLTYGDDDWDIVNGGESLFIAPNQTIAEGIVIRNGNVGIGTAPQAGLHVAQDSTGWDEGLRLTYGGDDWDIVNGGESLFIAPNQTIAEGMVIRNGNVGIGIAPQAGLHLKGADWPDSFMYIQSDNAQDAGIRLYEGTTPKWHIFNSTNDSGLRIYNSDASKTVFFAEQSSGNVGIGTTSPSKKLTVRGNLLLENESTGAAVVELGEGLDYSEGFDVTEESAVTPGTVLVIDTDNPGKLTVSSSPYDSKVAGIVAGGEGLGSGVRLGVSQFDQDVALAGRVYCKVDATESGVEPGDLLTTSGLPGYAMKATEYMRAQGAILGKAMEKLEQGKKGHILVLVTLQ
jgi:hypothetical protein